MTVVGAGRQEGMSEGQPGRDTEQHRQLSELMSPSLEVPANIKMSLRNCQVKL